MVTSRKGFAALRERGTAELNMVPMMNLFTVLVPILLLAAVFANITVLDMELPPAGSGETGVDRSEEKGPLSLVVVVAEEGITVGGTGGFLPTLLREEGVVDPDGLASLLAMVREEHPDETRVTVASESGIAYEEVIAVMDVCREGGFRDIALCALHDRPSPGEGGGP